MCLGSAQSHCVSIVANSATATGLEWQAAASGGGMTQLAAGDLSGSSVALTSISGSYKDLIIQISDIVLGAQGNPVYIKVNNTNIVGMSNIYSTSLGDGIPNSFIYVASSSASYYMNATANNAFSFRISNYAATNAKKAIFGAGGEAYTGDAPIRGYLFYGATENTNAVSSLYITTTGTTFSSGKYILYGVN